MIISMASHLRVATLALAFMAFPSSAVSDNINQILHFFDAECVNFPSSSDLTTLANNTDSRNFKLKDLGWNYCLNVTNLHLTEFDTDSKSNFYARSFYFEDPDKNDPDAITNACRFYLWVDNCSGPYTDVFSNGCSNIPSVPENGQSMSVECVQNERGNWI